MSGDYDYMIEQSPNVLFVVDPLVFLSVGCRVGRMPEAISGEEQLMTALEDVLMLPDYFGRNWDALSECLRDLSWLPPGGFALVHTVLPVLSEADLSVYVGVLSRSVGDRKRRGLDDLVVVFPECDRQHVLSLIARSKVQLHLE